MDDALMQKIKDAIAAANTIGVVVGQEPTVDEMAAGLSWYLMLNAVNKKTVIATPKDPIVEVSSLVGIDKVQTSFGGNAGDLVVSFPYAEGSIDKVSYTLENEQLNIIVKAGDNGIAFNEKDVKYTRGSGKIDLLFVIGTAQVSSIESLVNNDIVRGAKVVNIDNKSSNQKFGDILYVAPTASSVCELVGDIALALGLRIDQDVAQNLMNGLTQATNNFQSEKTSALAFEVASFAVKSGAKRDQASRDQASSFRTTPQERQQSQQISGQNWLEKHVIEEKTPEKPQQLQESIRPQNESVQRMQRIQEDLKQETAVNDGKAPIDWLSPKVYQGSTKV